MYMFFSTVYLNFSKQFCIKHNRFSFQVIMINVKQIKKWSLTLQFQFVFRKHLCQKKNSFGFHLNSDTHLISCLDFENIAIKTFYLAFSFLFL